MISERDLKNLISEVMKELNVKDTGKKEYNTQTTGSENRNLQDSKVIDISKVDLREVIGIKNPINREELLKYKRKTPARVGISRSGTRYTTDTMLRFRADHASAIDAVFTDLEEEFLEKNGLFTIQSKCESKDEYITRPDLGRRVSENGIKLLQEKCEKNPQVQIYICDGLSSTAVKANLEDILPSLLNGLKSFNISSGTPFYMKYGRVAAEDEVTEVVGSTVTCVLIGERPGLATAESMSAYITYKGYIGIPESKRTVFSNIHRKGTPAVEAGAHIAQVIKKMLDAKASGQDLKL